MTRREVTYAGSFRRAVHAVVGHPIDQATVSGRHGPPPLVNTKSWRLKVYGGTQKGRAHRVMNSTDGYGRTIQSLVLTNLDLIE
jgi:hypothetical protein